MSKAIECERGKPRSIYNKIVRVWDKFCGLENIDRRPRELYAVFRANPNLGWSTWFRKFQHVGVFGISEAKGIRSIVQVDHLANRTVFGTVVIDPLTVDHYLELLDRMGCTVIRCRIAALSSQIQIFPRLNPFNCVELTKFCLGVKMWGVYTPFALYKRLLKRDDCFLIKPKRK